jgi:uncharacterized protein (DUF1330 family)
MKVVNAVMPDAGQIEGFMEPDDGSTIYMVNLLKYKDEAEYADGRETQLSGREAYALYSKGVKECLEKVGGGVDFVGEVRRLMLGEVEDLWDDVAIARYPSRTAMLQMMQLPEMQEIGQHRAAGLAGQLNIETVDHSSAAQ